MIQVRLTAERDPFIFDVVVSEGKGETRHHVTMSRDMCERLTAGKHTPERCLEATFRFLLDREPKESILGRFDATVISRYFPEFERELPRYLSRSGWNRACAVFRDHSLSFAGLPALPNDEERLFVAELVARGVRGFEGGLET